MSLDIGIYNETIPTWSLKREFFKIKNLRIFWEEGKINAIYK